jgi:hypothetical protein
MFYILCNTFIGTENLLICNPICFTRKIKNGEFLLENLDASSSTSNTTMITTSKITISLHANTVIYQGETYYLNNSMSVIDVNFFTQMVHWVENDNSVKIVNAKEYISTEGSDKIFIFETIQPNVKTTQKYVTLEKKIVEGIIGVIALGAALDVLSSKFFKGQIDERLINSFQNKFLPKLENIKLLETRENSPIIKNWVEDNDGYLYDFMGNYYDKKVKDLIDDFNQLKQKGKELTDQDIENFETEIDNLKNSQEFEELKEELPNKQLITPILTNFKENMDEKFQIRDRITRSRLTYNQFMEEESDKGNLEILTALANVETEYDEYTLVQRTLEVLETRKGREYEDTKQNYMEFFEQSKKYKEPFKIPDLTELFEEGKSDADLLKVILSNINEEYNIEDVQELITKLYEDGLLRKQDFDIIKDTVSSGADKVSIYNVITTFVNNSLKVLNTFIEEKNLYLGIVRIEYPQYYETFETLLESEKSQLQNIEDQLAKEVSTSTEDQVIVNQSTRGDTLTEAQEQELYTDIEGKLKEGKEVEEEEGESFWDMFQQVLEKYLDAFEGV